MANAVRYIRKDVFGMTQAEFARLLGVEQPSVSRWEAKGFFPSEQQPVIRQSARDRGLAWSDSWFFEPPVCDAAIREAS